MEWSRLPDFFRESVILFFFQIDGGGEAHKQVRQKDFDV